MLTKLAVKNFAIIEELTIDFENNLTVITGETGAGKSILLGALELILGKRANHSVILNQEEKCFVEAYFNTPKHSQVNEILEKNDIEIFSDIIIRREISPNGRSRAFINDTPAKLELLQEVGGWLVNMHRQFDSYELLLPSEQLFLLDSYLQIGEERQLFQNNFDTYKKLKKELLAEIELANKAKAEKDYLEFVWNEIDELQLSENKIEAWIQKLELLENAQSIKISLLQAVQIIQNSDPSLIEKLQELTKNIGTFRNASPTIASLHDRIASVIEELKDIATELEIEENTISTDEEKRQTINEKVELANKLLHKHDVQTSTDLIAIGNHFEEKLNRIESSNQTIETLTQKVSVLLEKCKAQAEKISKKRVKGLKEFSKELNTRLPHLGFNNAQFEISHSFCELSSHGIDEISFLFDANNVGKLAELRNSISGGEMSRIMLAIKSLLANRTEMPCLIFDEIDTGISGETALKVAGILKELSSQHQVVSITHLPQIAAKADHHLFVSKDDTSGRQQTKVKNLSTVEREEAIAKMLSGKSKSKSALLAAKDLLNNN